MRRALLHTATIIPSILSIRIILIFQLTPIILIMLTIPIILLILLILIFLIKMLTSWAQAQALVMFWALQQELALCARV